MQIFALANICRNRINYKLEITGLMGFHAIAVDRAIWFLSDRHHRTVSAWQNPPYFSTYLTYSSFSTLISHSLPCFLSHLSRVHAYTYALLFPDEEIPASGCHRDNYNIIFTTGECSNVEALRERRLQMWELHKGLLVNTKQSLARLKNIREIFTINAFNQYDPSKRALLQLNIFKEANGSYFSYFNGFDCSPQSTQSLLSSIYLLAIIIALFHLFLS